MKLRKLSDSKFKTPVQYDEKNLFKDVFVTVWDAARLGNSDRLRQFISSSPTE